MARFLGNPAFIDFHQLFNKGKEFVPVEGLSMDRSVKVHVALEGVSYGEGESRGAEVHTLHVHFRSEESHFVVFISVRLHTLEECLSIMQNGRSGVDS
jgi:hypothetical protein